MGIELMIFAFTFMALFWGGMNFYAGKRVLQWLTFLFPHINRSIFAGVCIFISLPVILSYLPLPPAVKIPMRWTGAYWMGALIYLLIFFAAADIIILIVNSVKSIPAHKLKNIRFYAGTAAVLLTTGVFCYGLHNANQTKFVSYDIRLNAGLSDEMKIVFIADLHLGDVNSEKRLESIVRGINSLNPDIVCIAGDIFSDDYNTIRDPAKAAQLLKSIEAPYGVYASLGNHDGGRTLGKIMDFLERSSVKLLNDKHVVIDERLVLIGRLDARPIGGFGEMRRGDFSEVIAKVDTNLPVVVMNHNPANIKEYGGEVDLILSGHTHRGQLFPGSLVTRLLFTVDYGHYRRDSNSPHVIVTQGVHAWMMPMRVGTNNEIVSVTVR